jgi:hypothetical protein
VVLAFVTQTTWRDEVIWLTKRRTRLEADAQNELFPLPTWVVAL